MLTITQHNAWTGHPLLPEASLRPAVFPQLGVTTTNHRQILLSCLLWQSSAAVTHHRAFSGLEYETGAVVEANGHTVPHH